MSPDGPDPRRLGPTAAGLLAGLGLAGLVLGRLLRPLAEQVLGLAPLVSWSQPVALLVLAAVLGTTARATRRVLRVQRRSVAPHQALNRLALARASAAVGALVGGGYVGYAVAWLGSDSALAGERVRGSVASAVAAGLVVVTALLLERACRVPLDDPDA